MIFRILQLRKIKKATELSKEYIRTLPRNCCCFGSSTPDRYAYARSRNLFLSTCKEASKRITLEELRSIESKEDFVIDKYSEKRKKLIEASIKNDSAFSDIKDIPRHKQKTIDYIIYTSDTDNKKGTY